MSLIAFLLLGLVAGWLAGMFMKGGGYGIIGDMVVGVLGAFVGGWLFSMLLGWDVTGFNLPSILIAIYRAFVGRRAVV